MITGKNCDEPALWNEIIHDMQGHPLQLWGWGEVKSAHNWSAHRVLFVDENDVVEGAAQVLVRALPGPFRRLCYVPRGPVWQQGSEAAVLDALAVYVRRHLPGVEHYDMNGLLNDGVSTFKQGFASHENTLIGTLDYPLSPLYTVWSRALPAIKRTVRRAKSLVAKN